MDRRRCRGRRRGVLRRAVPAGPEDRLAADAIAAAPSGATCPAKTSANFDFTLKDAGGATVKLSDYKGKVVLLNFWATWCGPCKMEIPEFVEAYSRYRDRGFVILGVLSEDDPPQKDLQAFMSEFKMNYPVMRHTPSSKSRSAPCGRCPRRLPSTARGRCARSTGAPREEALEREINGNSCSMIP